MKPEDMKNHIMKYKDLLNCKFKECDSLFYYLTSYYRKSSFFSFVVLDYCLKEAGKGAVRRNSIFIDICYYYRDYETKYKIIETCLDYGWNLNSSDLSASTCFSCLCDEYDKTYFTKKFLEMCLSRGANINADDIFESWNPFRCLCFDSYLCLVGYYKGGIIKIDFVYDLQRNIKKMYNLKKKEIKKLNI
jgi:hypothetical protein